MLISLTVGKVDAGVAVLLTEDKRLIEFPSILLPSSITSGSVVDITVSRNLASEQANQEKFETLQSSILERYGSRAPAEPVLRCRNATQTSVVLEWDPIELATAELRSLSLYRNGAKAGSIPRPHEITSTKISGMAIDTEYDFQLVLRTSAGTYQSTRLDVRTHKMTDLSGITVTPGVLPAQLQKSLAVAVDRIGGKLVETVRIDTTHFVCTEGRGKEWERAVEMNIPVVRPEWIEGCEREGRIVGVRGYYLNADPRLRQVGQGVGLSGSGLVSAGSQSHSRSRNESRASINPPPNATEDQRRSSAAPSNIDVERIASPQTNVVPPTPPAKDPEREESKFQASPTRSVSPSNASVDTTRDEDKDEESAEVAKQRNRASISRSLVSSPANPAPQEQELPHRGAGAAAGAEAVSPQDKPAIESEAMDDVDL